MSLINKKLKQIGRRFSVNGKQTELRPHRFFFHFISPFLLYFRLTGIEVNPDSVGIGGNQKRSCQHRNSTKSEPDDNYERLEVKQLLQINPTDEYGFEQWHNAMRMVARLPGGIPSSFRRKVSVIK